MPKRLLPLEHLQALSQRIRVSDDAAELKALLAHVLKYYDAINFQFSYDQTFWRGVRCDSDQGFAQIQRVGHPPAHLAKCGRLNEAGHPVLYASINPFAVLEEIGAKPGEFVHVVAYSLRPGIRLKSSILGEVTQVSRWGRALLSENIGNELNRIMRDMSPDVGRSFVSTDSLLASIFRDPNAAVSEYVRSRTLARLLFAEVHGLEAIIYPSVAHEGAMNFAITPAAVHEKLSIGATFVIRVKGKYDYGIYDYETVRRAGGHRDNGVIVWE